MKKVYLSAFFIYFLLIAGKSACYAQSVVPPTTPAWNTTPAIVFSNTEIGLYWNASTSTVGLAGYYIYRCTGTSCTLPGQPTFNVNSSSSTNYGDATLSAGTTYSYSIAAYDTAGDISAQSPVITATTQGNVSAIIPVIGLAEPTTPVGTAGGSFTFNMTQSSLSSGGAVFGNLNYSWNWAFGDGTFQTAGSSVTHEYVNPGTYTLRLTIFDTANGDSSFVEQQITVLPAAVSGLVLRLRSNGDINDYSGNQLPISAGGSGVPAFGPGISGHGIYFNGSSNGAYVDVKDNALLDGLSALTLGVHAMKNTATASGTIYIKQGQYSISLASQGVTATLTNNTGSTITLSAPSVANNNTNWHHYALTYDGSTAILYFDGTAVDSQSFSGVLANNPSADLLLGVTPSGNTFNGSLDWVRLYNEALTVEEVQFLYNGTDYGDANGGGSDPVGIYDAYLTAEYAVALINFNTAQLEQAEVLSSGVNPTIYDAELIAQKSVGLILKFPADISEE